MSVVISFLTSLLFIACLIYVPICAIVALARSLADPGDGKIARGEEWVGKLFSWRCLLWAVYALFILFCMGSADCHPVHDGMTEAESKILCWKALLFGLEGVAVWTLCGTAPALCSGAGFEIQRSLCCHSYALSAVRRWAGGIQEVETCAVWPCCLRFVLVLDGVGLFMVLEIK